MISILVPTKNRPDFLIRLLSYYTATQLEYPICIGDSSDEDDIERTQTALKLFSRKLKIFYHRFPNLGLGECYKQLAQFVSTPYVVPVPDDDFIVPRGMHECINFLESHSDYNAANGVGALFGLQNSGPYGKLSAVFSYPLRAIEHETAAKRLLDHLGNYSVTLFSVHRTNSWRSMWQNVDRVPHTALSSELLPCCLSVIQGKIKSLSCFYLVRQAHPQRHVLPDPFDWITSPGWPRSYEVFRDCLAQELVRRDRITVTEARDIVKQAFWRYLSQGLVRKWDARYGRGRDGQAFSCRLREAARIIPGLRGAWHMARELLPRKNDALTLEKLFQSSSPYHEDFMSIYRAITKKI